mmetsp:Transcript_2741/g.4079  ORF Transcript_2741/g.4079 Transcript_2741/m.4079 type:complete len:134 (-) Transcript_2741:18-419(-)
MCFKSIPFAPTGDDSYIPELVLVFVFIELLFKLLLLPLPLSKNLRVGLPRPPLPLCVGERYDADGECRVEEGAPCREKKDGPNDGDPNDDEIADSSNSSLRRFRLFPGNGDLPIDDIFKLMIWNGTNKRGAPP